MLHAVELSQAKSPSGDRCSLVVVLGLRGDLPESPVRWRRRPGRVRPPSLCWFKTLPRSGPAGGRDPALRRFDNRARHRKTRENVFRSIHLPVLPMRWRVRPIGIRSPVRVGAETLRCLFPTRWRHPPQCELRSKPAHQLFVVHGTYVFSQWQDARARQVLAGV